LNLINIDESSPFVNLVPAVGLNQMAAAAVSRTAEDHPGVITGVEGKVVFLWPLSPPQGWPLLFIVPLAAGPADGKAPRGHIPAMSRRR
jgi:hypothetical protein